MISELVSQITSAIETGDFEEAEPLLANFFSSLETDLAQMPAMQDRAVTLQDALGWMHRWLDLARIMRSHLNEQLRFNVRETSYCSAVGNSSIVELIG